MKKDNTLLTVAAVAAGVLLLKKSQSVSGISGNHQTIIGKLLLMDGHKSSTSGNPSYHLVIQGEDGRIINGRTAPNASLGYMLSYGMEGGTYLWEYHRTPSGKTIIDYMRKVDGNFLWN